MTRIFYMPRTRSSRVLWALHEVGAQFDSTRIAGEERRSPELEATLYRFMREPPEAGQDSSDFRRFTDAATAFADALGGGPWILGAQFTLADIVCVGVLGSANSRGLLEAWPRLSEYVERGEGRPAHQAAVAFGE